MLDPREPPEPVPGLPEELCRLDNWRDSDKQRENLKDVNFLIDTSRVREYLAKTEGKGVVCCTVSAELYDGDPISHRECHDRHELDEWVVISDRSPNHFISTKR